MTKRKRQTFVERLEDTVGDMANAASFAATGSDIGTLELAAEDELNPRKPPRNVKVPKKRKRKRSRPSERNEFDVAWIQNDVETECRSLIGITRSIPG
jgi:hypothetical protein